MEPASNESIVLVVDDSPTVRKFVHKCLKPHDYRVNLAANGTQAVASARTEHPSIALVDLTMGEECGIDVIRRFDEELGQCDFPIVLMSGKGEAAWEIGKGSKGVVAAISKPFDSASLISIIETQLRRRTREREERELIEQLSHDLIHGTSFDPDEETLRSAHVVRDVSALLADRLKQTLSESIRASAHLGREHFVRSVTDSLLSAAFLEAFSMQVDELYRQIQGQFTATADTLNFADALQSICNKNVTGVLRVSGRDAEVELHVQDRLIRVVNPTRVPVSENETALYCTGVEIPASILVCGTSTAPADTTALLEWTRQSGVDPEQAPRILLSIGIDVLRSCLETPQECSFKFFHRGRFWQGIDVLDLHLPAERFLLKLFSRIDEWAALENALANGDMTFRRRSDLASNDEELLSPMQRELLAQVDESESVGDLCSRTKLSAFEVCHNLHTLERMGLVESNRVVSCLQP